MSDTRSTLRHLALALAVLLMSTSVLDGVEAPAVRAADPSPSAGTAAVADFRLPDDGSLVADGLRAVSDAPVDSSGPLDVGPAIQETYSAGAALPRADWEVPALAASLGHDPAAAFMLLRDSIGFDPYRGMLRGADGTLAARSGNSADRATLLRALLTEMGVTSRFAFGDVDSATAALLVARAFDHPVRPLRDAGNVTLAPLDPDAIAIRARRDYARLRGALGDRVDTMGVATVGGAPGEVMHHTWVQVQDATGAWVDYDPSMPGSRPGQTLAKATSTGDEIPASDRQTVTIRVIAETMTGSSVTESVLLEQRLDVADAAARDLFLYFQPTRGGAGLGLLDTSGSATSYMPVLLIDDQVRPGDPFAIGDGGGAGGVFGDFGGGGGGAGGPAFLSLRLAVTRGQPGQAPRETTHVLIDRVPAEARAAGTVASEQLLPLAMGPAGPLAFGAVHHIMVSNGGSEPRTHAIERGVALGFVGGDLLQGSGFADHSLSDILWPFAVLDDTLVVASERAVMPAIDSADGLRSFIGRPRIYIASFGPGPGGPDTVEIATDLSVDGISVMGGERDRGLAAREQLWYGVLQGALETEFGQLVAAAISPGTRRSSGVSLLMDQPLIVLGGDDAGTLPGNAARALVAALGDGQLTVIPGDPGTAVAWWTVDPVSGASRSNLEPGLGGFTSGGQPTTNPPVEPEAYEMPDYVEAAKAKKLLANRQKCTGTEYEIFTVCIAKPLAWVIGGTVGLVLVILVFRAIGQMIKRSHGERVRDRWATRVADATSGRA